MNNIKTDKIKINVSFKSTSEFWLWFGNFLDSIYRTPELLNRIDEPNLNDEKLNSFFVGSLHKLMSQYGYTAPMWIFKKEYFLKKPWFVGGFKGDYNIFLLRETPTEFRARNIFVAENVLSRV